VDGRGADADVAARSGRGLYAVGGCHEELFDLDTVEAFAPATHP
jgi:hypothetical protein